MPLTLKIKKPSQQPAEPPLPTRRGSKRRAAPVPTTQEDEDEDEEYEAKEPRRPSKRARTTDSVEEEVIDVEGDGDGEVKLVEDETRFLSDSDDVNFPLTISRATSSTSVKSKGKRAARAPASSSAPASKKSKRAQVVWSDDEEEDTRRDPEYAEETTTRADEGDDYAGTDDDFAPSPKRSVSKGKASKAPAKGKARSSKDREKESRPVTVKDERKAVAPVSKAREAARGTPATPSVKGQSTDAPGTPQDAPGAGSSTSIATPADLFKDEPPPPPPATTTPLPSFKRKLPTMKKNKPPAGASASSTPTQTSVAKPRPRPPSESAPKEQKPPDDGLPILKKTAQNADKVEVDLSNKDVYASLFKAAGPSVPRSGVAQKEKEERRKELDRLRDADRARRQAEAEHVFDLRAQHDKIASFEERLRARKSGAVYPNILGCAFRHEKEKEARRHQRVLAEQNREKGELLEDE